MCDRTLRFGQLDAGCRSGNSTAFSLVCALRFHPASSGSGSEVVKSPILRESYNTTPCPYSCKKQNGDRQKQVSVASDETAIVLVSGSRKKKLRGGRGRRALE